MMRRRTMLQHGAAVAALLAALPESRAQAGWNKAAFESRNVDEALKALGLARPVASPQVTLQAPDLHENGALVPVAAASSAPGTKRLLLLVEKNPATLVAAFDFTEAVEPVLRTNVKMAQSSNVYAVAITGDGKVLYAVKDVKITLGGCGE